MTSVEKDNDCTYLGIEAPEYAIITYTWGRFAAPKGSPALPIKGVTWSIPPVKESCFSVDSFQRVIDEIGEEYTWLWLDVGCIDQENEEIKTSEIARQVGIFYGASAAYAWLHSLDSETLEEALRYLSGVAEFKRQHEFFLGSDVTVRTRAKADRLQFYESEMDDGRSAPEYGYCRRIKSLNFCCQVIWQNIQQLAARLPQGAQKAKAENIILSIEKAGLNFDDATNPNIQYSWARHRETQDSKDRIYGIVGIYDTVLQGSFRPPPPSRVNREDLENAFGLALNDATPWLAQCFIHLERPKPGRSWCITQDSSVPLQFVHEDSMSVMVGMESTGTISSSRPGMIVARGMACPLKTLWEYWSNMRASGSTLYSERYTYTLSIAYDRLVADLVTDELGQQFKSPIIEWIDPELEDHANDFRVTQCLLSAHQVEHLHVLQMGYNSNVKVKPAAVDDRETLRLRVQQEETFNHPDCHNETGTLIMRDQEFLEAMNVDVDEIVNISVQDFLPEMTTKFFGLILLRNDTDFWQRIGICRWTGEDKGCREMVDWEGKMA
jgi:hypothetical protein